MINFLKNKKYKNWELSIEEFYKSNIEIGKKFIKTLVIKTRAIFIINIRVEGVNRAINYLNLRLRAASDFFLRLTLGFRKIHVYVLLELFHFLILNV